MKKYLLIGAAMLGLLATVPYFTACSNDKEDEEIKVDDAIIKVEGAKVKQGQMPAANASSNGYDINFQGQALAGGGNIITINSPKPLSKVYLAVDGENSYLECVPKLVDNDSRATSTADIYQYVVEVLYGINMQNDIRLTVNAETKDGEIVNLLKREAIEYVESQKGDLAINLVFDQDKDVDLWLVFPEGKHRIYYGNKTLSAVYDENEWNEYYAAYQTEYERLERKYKHCDEYGTDDYYAFWTELNEWVETHNPEKIDENKARGLDHDSNAACDIDHLNNENIVIDAEFLIPGEYKVYVNLYRNCYPQENDTRWTLVARTGNYNLQTIQGGNPTSGYFRYDAPSNPNDFDDQAVLAMTFRLSQSQIDEMKRGSRSNGRTPKYIFSAPLDNKAINKIIDGNGRFMWNPIPTNLK